MCCYIHSYMYESHISSDYSIFISIQMIIGLVFILLAVSQKSERNLLSATAYSAGKLALKIGCHGWNAGSWSNNTPLHWAYLLKRFGFFYIIHTRRLLMLMLRKNMFSEGTQLKKLISYLGFITCEVCTI